MVGIVGCGVVGRAAVVARAGGCRLRQRHWHFVYSALQEYSHNVVVDEHDGMFGLFDEADDVGVGIKDLAVVEDALHGW